MNSESPDRRVAPEIKELTGRPLPKAARRRLPNGVELVVLNHGEQPVNRMSVVWNAGDADVEQPEALALLCQTITEGTANRTGAEITELLEYNGAWMRMDSSAHATTLTLHSLNHTAEDVIPMAGEMISEAVHPESELVRMRARLAARLETDMRKVVTKATVMGKKMLYGEGNPMSRSLSAGRMAEVSREDVTSLHRRLLKGNVPMVYLAGKITPELESVVERVFGSLVFGTESDAIVKSVVKCPDHRASLMCMEEDETSMQTAVNVIIPAIDRKDPDYEQLRFTVFALGGYFGSRLMSNIREDKGYTYGITASLGAAPEGGSIKIACQTDNRHTGNVLAEIENEIGRLANEPMDGEELAVVRHTIMSGLTSLLDSPFTIMDYHRQIDAMNLGEDYYSHQLDELSRFDAQSAMDMARKYLLDAPRLTALAGQDISMDQNVAEKLMPKADE